MPATRSTRASPSGRPTSATAWQTYLYATDFHNGRIDVFDNAFASQTWSGAFVDPKLPKGYAPFGIQNLKGLIFVTYAKTQPGSDDEVDGKGLGVVDVFLTDGTFFGRVAKGDGLNAPWGMAWAPADFGPFSGDLIVGNFGDGKLHAYAWNGSHWHADGVLTGEHHKALSDRRPVGHRRSAAGPSTTARRTRSSSPPVPTTRTVVPSARSSRLPDYCRQERTRGRLMPAPRSFASARVQRRAVLAARVQRH